MHKALKTEDDEKINRFLSIIKGDLSEEDQIEFLMQPIKKGEDTVLHVAAKMGNKDAVYKVLALQKYLPRDFINAKNKEGCTALCLAAKQTQAKLGAAQAVEIKLGALEVEKVEVEKAVKALDYQQIVERLLKEQDIDLSVPGYTNLLDWAAYINYERIVKLILGSKIPIDVNMEGPYGSPLYIASRRGHKVIVELLVNYPTIDINLENSLEQKNAKGKYKSKYTALHTAALNNRLDVVNILLAQKDIKPEPKGIYDATPLHVAVEGNCQEVVDLLVDRTKQRLNDKLQGVYDNSNPLGLAVKKGFTGIVNTLLKQETIAVSDLNKYKDNVLHVAVRFGQLSTLQSDISHKIFRFYVLVNFSLKYTLFRQSYSCFFFDWAIQDSIYVY